MLFLIMFLFLHVALIKPPVCVSLCPRLCSVRGTVETCCVTSGGISIVVGMQTFWYWSISQWLLVRLSLNFAHNTSRKRRCVFFGNCTTLIQYYGLVICFGKHFSWPYPFMTISQELPVQLSLYTRGSRLALQGNYTSTYYWFSSMAS